MWISCFRWNWNSSEKNDVLQKRYSMNSAITLVDRKFNSCKILQDSYKKVQFLKDSGMQWHSCKILARNCALSQGGKSYKILARLRALSHESCKILQEINHLYTHYVLIIYAIDQKASIIIRLRWNLINFTPVERILYSNVLKSISANEFSEHIRFVVT